MVLLSATVVFVFAVEGIVDLSVVISEIESQT